MLHKTLVTLPDPTAENQSGLSVHEALDGVPDEALVAERSLDPLREVTGKLAIVAAFWILFGNWNAWQL